MTDQWTDLEAKAVALRDAAGADQIHYALEAFESAANPATILALISQAREAERIRGALTVALPAMEWAEAHVGGHAKYESAQQVVNSLAAHEDALEAVRQALAPATGGGDA